MLIVLYIFWGLLFFDCLIACRFYFQKERPFEQYEEQLFYLKSLKSTESGKVA